MLIAAGLLLLVLGVVCGAILVLAPLGLIAADTGVTLWILFPAFTLGGYLLAAAPAGDARLPTLSRLMGVLLLVLALVAAVALVMQGASMLETRGSAVSLWYVLGVGLLLGVTALASHRRA